LFVLVIPARAVRERLWCSCSYSGSELSVSELSELSVCFPGWVGSEDSPWSFPLDLCVWGVLGEFPFDLRGTAWLVLLSCSSVSVSLWWRPLSLSAKAPILCVCAMLFGLLCGGWVGVPEGLSSVLLSLLSVLSVSSESSRSGGSSSPLMSLVRLVNRAVVDSRRIP
jgi:hypothetical protein